MQDMEGVRDVYKAIKKSCPEFITARDYADAIQGNANAIIEAKKKELEGKDEDGQKLRKFANELKAKVDKDISKDDKAKLELYGKEQGEEIEAKLTKEQAELAIRFLEGPCKDSFLSVDGLLDSIDFLKSFK